MAASSRKNENIPKTFFTVKVMAVNTGKIVQEVTAAMLARTTLNPEEAKAWGVSAGNQSELFEIGSEVISVHYQTQPSEDNGQECPYSVTRGVSPWVRREWSHVVT